jgi:hypothetical protein
MKKLMAVPTFTIKINPNAITPTPDEFKGLTMRMRSMYLGSQNMSLTRILCAMPRDSTEDNINKQSLGGALHLPPVQQ